MKRNVNVVADDGEVRVQVTARVLSRNGLVRDEVESIIKGLSRGIADLLRGVPYTDYGIENTRVRR